MSVDAVVPEGSRMASGEELRKHDDQTAARQTGDGPALAHVHGAHRQVPGRPHLQSILILSSGPFRP